MEDVAMVETIIQSYLVDAPLLALVFYMVWRRDIQITRLLDIIQEQNDKPK